MTHLSREKILERANRLPSLSVVVHNILASIGNPTSSTVSLAHQIGRDPAITSRVLRVANSAFYGHSEKVCSIADAVVILGLDTVRSIALSATLLHWINKAGMPTHLDSQSFWRYLVGTAICAQAIAEVTAATEREPAFIAGLLHGIGRLLLDTQFPEMYSKVLASAQQTDVDLAMLEKETLGLDSATAGYLVLTAWRFPASIRNAVRDHVHPTAPVDAIAAITHAAFVLAHALEFGDSGQAKVPRLSEPAWDKLGLSMAQLRTCLPKIQSRYVGITQMLAA